jgi:hypothetical protein
MGRKHGLSVKIQLDLFDKDSRSFMNTAKRKGSIFFH